MELWIRSQDKERLIKVENLYVEYNGDVDPNLHTYRIVTDKFVELGTYISKERALEVLDEIQARLKNNIHFQKNNLCLKNGYDNLYIPYEESLKVYEMPKE